MSPLLLSLWLHILNSKLHWAYTMLNERQKNASLKALKRAVALFGTQQALADALGVTHAAVSRWLAGTATCSIYNATQIANVTKGVVTAGDIRPDLAESFK